MTSKGKGQKGNGRRDDVSIPGTYKISIRRVDKTGEEKKFTCYVPTHPRGLKELLRLNFRGVPGLGKPQYFMTENEFRRFDQLPA